jgi:hypothetical protein
MLTQLASLKVGSMRTGYTAAASFTTTTRVGADVSEPVGADVTLISAFCFLLSEFVVGTSMRAANSLPVASVARNRL